MEMVIARAGGDSSFEVDPKSTYAELWMGTHSNGPSRIVRDGKPAELLSDYLQEHPEAMGTTTGELPFLFKVLSVQKALSIQAHPDVALARRLHATKPDLYKDANHKPEMAIALTQFEALSQFRKLSEIVGYLESVPELRALVDDKIVQQLIGKQDVASLRAFFKSFIYADLEVVTLQLQSLRSRLETQAQNGRVALTPVEKLVLRLNAEYSNDIGCFCPYILNYITLQPGEAVFLGANEPHAYLSGDCIECMACSDNVVRAGLTPKYIDKVTLHEMLTYRTGPPTVFKGDKVNEMSRLYSPPVPEFQVEVIELAAYQHYAVPKREDSPSVLLVVSGSASGTCGEEAPFTLSKGSVFFVPAGEELDLRCGSDGISAFRASPNQSARQH
uniref:mannose-6-phosphate isomerase n=1 Tax=Globisporangium ultimum (strain ATCC 200006 / CBS 805.95 / DAOM BR144) TaxID=431595 RepID=K3X7I7_GLOUD